MAAAQSIVDAPEGVEARVWFPDAPTREFVVGKHIGAVIGIRNNGDVGFNVSAIQGNLALIHEPAENVRVEIERPTLACSLACSLARSSHAPTRRSLALRHSLVLQVMNFTGNAYQYPEHKKDDETTTQYFMPLHHSLPARAFYLQLSVFSEGGEGGDLAIMQAFNSTIELIEEPKLIDMELLGLYAVLFGFLAAVAWGVREYAIEKGIIGGGATVTKKRASSSKKAPAKKAPADSNANEWLRGTIADKSKAKKK